MRITARFGCENNRYKESERGRKNEEIHCKTQDTCDRRAGADSGAGYAVLFVRGWRYRTEKRRRLVLLTAGYCVRGMRRLHLCDLRTVLDVCDRRR